VIYIWVRRTLDWDDEAAAFAGVDERMKPKVQTWNETFTMTYQRFRCRLSQIAGLNHAQVQGAVRADWNDIPDESIVLPVDDDDWFAPQAARVLEREFATGSAALSGPPAGSRFRWTRATGATRSVGACCRSRPPT
jgi:hypothetical protein